MSSEMISKYGTLTSHVVTVQESTDLTTAVRLLRARDVHHLIVMSDEDSQEVTGVISEQNIFERGVDRQNFSLDNDLRVGDVMMDIPCCLRETTTISDALDMMWSYHVTALPIEKSLPLNAPKNTPRLMGVVSAGDLLRALAQMAEDEAPGVGDVGARSKVMMSHPLVQNAMQLIGEAGI